MEGSPTALGKIRGMQDAVNDGDRVVACLVHRFSCLVLELNAPWFLCRRASMAGCEVPPGGVESAVCSRSGCVDDETTVANDRCLHAAAQNDTEMSRWLARVRNGC